jgi:hypothetical protein
MSDVLGKIFGTPAKVKIMRLFIFNPDTPFAIDDVCKRVAVSGTSAKKEVQALIKSDFIKKKVFFRNVEKRKNGKLVTEKIKSNGFIFNNKFPFSEQFKNILMEAEPLRPEVLSKKFNKAGRIKLVVVSGLFIHEPESRLDLLVVGDRLNKTVMDKTVKTLEGEIGRELRYAFLETPDFNYRMSVYDRLLRDVFDFPHQKILDKMGTSSEE